MNNKVYFVCICECLRSCICYTSSTKTLILLFLLKCAIVAGPHNFKGLFEGQRHGFKVVVRFRGLFGVVRVRVASWVLVSIYESPHKDKNRRMYLCVYCFGMTADE